MKHCEYLGTPGTLGGPVRKHWSTNHFYGIGLHFSLAYVVAQETFLIAPNEKGYNMPDKETIFEILAACGITRDAITDAAMEFYVPHPGIETEERARQVFERELDFAVSDPNLCILLYAATLLEAEGTAGRLPGMTAEAFERDPVFLIADEVIGIAIAKYIAGYKGMFEFTRFDQNKPGILGELGPFLDDAIAGLIGGVSSNMYSRGMM